MKLKLVNGESITPKKDSIVTCGIHNTTVKWGDLDAIQQEAVACGICTTEDCQCLMTRGHLTRH